MALESEANVDEEMDPVIGEVSELIIQVEDAVRERDMDEQEFRDQTREYRKQTTR